jgi:hypothetical protein
MSRGLVVRTAVLAGMAGAALALSGNALATQKLEVTQTASPASVTVRLSQDGTDPQPAKITVYVPAGYTLGASPAAGTTIGTTEGEVNARDLGGISLPLSGDVVVDNPANHLTDVCAPGTHAAVWILRLSISGQTIALPVYVDPTSGAEAALGSAKLVTCLGPSDVPAGTPGRAANGAQLRFASFTVNGVLTPPVGPARWIAFTTPYNPGVGTPNVAGTVETRAFVGPGAVTLTTKVTSKKKKQVTLSGRVTQSGLAVATEVSLLVNGRVKATANSNGSGRFSKKVKGTGKRSVFQASVTVDARDLSAAGCGSPTQAPIPCVSATAGAFTGVSRKVTVRF